MRVGAREYDNNDRDNSTFPEGSDPDQITLRKHLFNLLTSAPCFVAVYFRMIILA